MTNNNPSLVGIVDYRNETTGYPMIFNIEADQRKKRNIAIENTWVVPLYSQIIADYMTTLWENPNPPVANVSIFKKTDSN